MIMCKKFCTRVFVLNLVIFCLLSNFAFGNSAPILIEENPSFSIAPIDNSPIEVVNEYLEFEILGDKGEIAKVTAQYEMQNSTDVLLKQDMLFPFITSPRDRRFDEKAKISKNGIRLQHQISRITNLPQSDYQTMQYKDKSNEDLAKLIDIDNIVHMLNSYSRYESKNFSLEDQVRVYTLHIPITEEQYRAEVDFDFNVHDHMLLYYNFNSYSLNNNGTGKFGTWSSLGQSISPQEKSYIAIMGNLEEQIEITSPTGHEITVEEKTLEEFIKEMIMESKGMYLEDNTINEVYNSEEDLIDYIAEEIDVRIDRKEATFSLDGDGISSFYNSTYLGALIYSVDFAPNEIVNVTVEYEMKASIDRRATREFSNMFMYILNPASRWKDFGNLNIKIIPKEVQPYIIDSSLPLVRDDTTGIYTGEFNGLPNNDFYFVAYKTDEPDPPPSKYISIVPYLIYMFFPFIIVILLSTGIIFLFYRLNRKQL